MRLLAAGGLGAQSLQIPAGEATPVGPTAQSFQGSLPTGEATGQTIDLSLDDAIERGLKTNLGMILSGTQTAAARGQRLSELQALLPEVDFKAQESLAQVDLPAQGLRIPGISEDYRAVRLYGRAGDAELVAGECGVAAQLHGGEA